MHRARSVAATVLLFAATTLAQGPSASTQSHQNPQSDSSSLEPIEAPQPPYPEKALKKNIAGNVLVQILVAESGNVEATQVVKGDAALKDAAENAAKGWKFKPFLKGGIAVPAIAILNFGFGNDEHNNSQSSPKVGVTIENSRPMTSKVRINQGVMQRLQILKVDPAYPEAAKMEHIQGSVVMQVIIDREGKIRDVNVTSGPPELTDAAVVAVRQWQYKPFLLMGRPVEVETQILINFNLNWIGTLASAFVPSKLLFGLNEWYGDLSPDRHRMLNPVHGAGGSLRTVIWNGSQGQGGNSRIALAGCQMPVRTCDLSPGTHLSADGKTILIPRPSDETQAGQLQKYNTFRSAFPSAKESVVLV